MFESLCYNINNNILIGSNIKNKEKQLSRILRKQGCSLNEIAKKLNTSKSSISIWVRDIENITKKELFLTGVSFYWAEGTKTIRSGVQFSNSDSRAIKFIMQFFRKCCEVPEKKFRGRVFIHSHLNIEKAEKYWHQISKIPLNQFHKPAIKKSKSSKGKKDNLPFGTFNIQICNTELFLKLKGWIEGLSETNTYDD